MSLLPRRSQRISANPQGAKELAARTRRLGRVIDESLAQSVRDVGTDAELAYQAHAPRRSHRLAHGIKAIPAGDQVFVSAVAVDPKSGFDYVDVTRFGHRKRVIVPVTKGGRVRKSRRVARTAGGQFAGRAGGRLVFTSRGRLWRLASVRGFRPRTDWVADAYPDIEAAAATEMDRTGNKVAVTWAG